jgi:hypothetical protein
VEKWWTTTKVVDDVGMVLSCSGGNDVGRYIGSGCLCVGHLISPVKQC